MLELLVLLSVGVAGSGAVGLTGIAGDGTRDGDFEVRVNPGDIDTGGKWSSLLDIPSIFETRFADGPIGDEEPSGTVKTYADVDTVTDDAIPAAAFDLAHVLGAETEREPDTPSGGQQTSPAVGEDGPVIIEDFHPDEEELVLLVGDRVSEDAGLSVEPGGETGEDASVVVEDGQNRLVAAIIRGGFGTVSPDQIHLKWDQ